MTKEEVLVAQEEVYERLQAVELKVEGLTNDMNKRIEAWEAKIENGLVLYEIQAKKSATVAIAEAEAAAAAASCAEGCEKTIQALKDGTEALFDQVVKITPDAGLALSRIE